MCASWDCAGALKARLGRRGWLRRPKEAGLHTLEWCRLTAGGIATSRWPGLERIFDNLLSVWPLQEHRLALQKVCNCSQKIAGIAIVRLQ